MPILIKIYYYTTDTINKQLSLASHRSSKGIKEEGVGGRGVSGRAWSTFTFYWKRNPSTHHTLWRHGRYTSIPLPVSRNGTPRGCPEHWFG